MYRRFLPLTLLAVILVLGACSEDTPLGGGHPTAPGSDFAKTRNDTFELLAYDLDAVFVAGSMNGWTQDDPNWEMTLQPDGYTWRLIKAMPDNVIQYKYVLTRGPETAWLTDPAATEVVSSGSSGSPSYWNAVKGSAFNTPQPMPYALDRSRLVIYEMSLNDFSSTGTFAGAVAGLTAGSDLEDLGVNAIEILPVTAPSYNGWGYDPVLQWAPNPAFGWPSTFAYLVDQCHQRGIAVILDVVVNHMAGSAPLRQLDDFTGRNDFTTTESNPWGLVELNWTNDALRQHILDGLSHWVEAYKVDGFRFDYVGGEPYSTWIWLRAQLLARHPDLLLIAEDFSYPANSVTYGYDAQWGGNHTDQWGGGGNNFNQVMITTLTEAGFCDRGQTTPHTGAWGVPYNNMWAVANVLSGNSNYAGSNPGDGFSDVKYLESHDENRVVWAVDTYGSAGAQAVGGLAKAQLGAVISMTSVGIPMLFNGQEIGSGEYRTANPSTYKINWAAGDTDVRGTYKRLIELRLERSALASENIFFHWRDSNLDNAEFTLCYWRGETGVSSQATVVVAANFDHTDHDLPVPFPTEGWWTREDLAAGTGTNVWVPAEGLTLTVPASTALVWTRVPGITAAP